MESHHHNEETIFVADRAGNKEDVLLYRLEYLFGSGSRVREGWFNDVPGWFVTATDREFSCSEIQIQLREDIAKFNQIRHPQQERRGSQPPSSLRAGRTHNHDSPDNESYTSDDGTKDSEIDNHRPLDSHQLKRDQSKLSRSSRHRDSSPEYSFRTDRQPSPPLQPSRNQASIRRHQPNKLSSSNEKVQQQRYLNTSASREGCLSGTQSQVKAASIPQNSRHGLQSTQPREQEPSAKPSHGAQSRHAQTLPLRTTLARAKTEPSTRLPTTEELPPLARFNGSYHNQIEAARAAAQAGLHGSSARKAVSECGTTNTYIPCVRPDVNYRTRIQEIACVGEGDLEVVTDAFLDSGAPHDFISLYLWQRIHGARSRSLAKDNDTEVSSANGTPIDILGTTKFKFHWRDHYGQRQTRKMRFHVVKDLYPPMIFALQTYTDLEFPKVADTWPTHDSKRGLFMFNMPWKNKKQMAIDALAVREIESANAAKAKKEIEDQARERNAGRHSTEWNRVRRSNEHQGQQPSNERNNAVRHGNGSNISDSRSDASNNSRAGAASRHTGP